MIYRFQNKLIRLSEYRRNAVVAALCVLILIILFVGICALLDTSFNAYAATSSSVDIPSNSFFKYYKQAKRFQDSGDSEDAASQYSLFLVSALQKIANYRARIGEYQLASPLYEAGIAISKNDASLYLDYAEASLLAGNAVMAEDLANKALVMHQAKPGIDAEAHAVLGRAYWIQGNFTKENQQFEAAYKILPSYKNGRALAASYLGLADVKNTMRVFAEMQAAYGDTAENHIDFGRVYGAANYPEEAIQEFQRAIQLNDHLPMEHYLLGISNLVVFGNKDNFKIPKAEFNKEIAIRPDDSRCYYFLGYIAQFQRQPKMAAFYYERSIQYNKQNPDAYLALGKIYADMGDDVRAKNALQQAILETKNVSRRQYQIKDAYYLLGHLMIKDGDQKEGKQYIQKSEKLLIENYELDKDKMNGNTPTMPNISMKSLYEKTDVNTKNNVEVYVKLLKPAIADAYNNLGVIQEKNKQYDAAIYDFEQAELWNPAMPRLDYNLGCAAFVAHQYARAVAPLGREMRARPNDKKIRIMLAMSQYFLLDYSQVLTTLQPIHAQLNSEPLLAYIYAESMVQTGNYQSGVDQFKVLLQADSIYLDMLHDQAKIYVSSANYHEAYELAQCMFALGNKDDAQALLDELTRSGFQYKKHN